MNTCHLCEEPLLDAPVVGTVARGGRPSRRVACARCGFVQVAPPPSAAELQHYYETAYHAEHGPVPLVLAHLDEDGNVVDERSIEPADAHYDEAIAVMHRSRARFIQGELGLPVGARILEIGCSDGRTARELERLGYEVDGVEPDSQKAAQARERLSGDVFVGFLDAGPACVDVPRDYDAVISFHVLEHFLDPLHALQRMSRLVKGGGHVWAEVPDTMRASLPLEDHWQWVHVFDFTAPTLAALFLRAGLGFVDVRQTHPAHLHARGRRVWADETPPWAFDEIVDFVPQGLPHGAAVAAHLAALRRGQDGTAIAADPDDAHRRWLAGESVVDLAELRAWIPPAAAERIEEQERALRVATAADRDATASILKAWDQSVEMIGTQAHRLAVGAFPLFESYEQNADPETRGFLNGLAMGRGTERERASKLLAFLANAMRRKEMSE